MSPSASPSAGNTFIHQEIDFPEATPARTNETLVGEQWFTACTGAPAQIQHEPGGAFTLFGGRVTGRQVELIANRRIVQAWRVEAWPNYMNV